VCPRQLNFGPVSTSANSPCIQTFTIFNEGKHFNIDFTIEKKLTPEEELLANFPTQDKKGKGKNKGKKDAKSKKKDKPKPKP